MDVGRMYQEYEMNCTHAEVLVGIMLILCVVVIVPRSHGSL